MAPMLRSFYAYDPSLCAAASIVSAGDIDGDGKADIVTGAGAGGAPHVQVFNDAGKTSTASSRFNPLSV